MSDTPPALPNRTNAARAEAADTAQEETRKEQLARLVLDRWRKSHDELMEARRHYWLNFAFYRGQQWLYWDSVRNQAEPLTPHTYEGERLRVTINKFQPRINAVIGRLADKDLSFEAQPDAADDVTLKAGHLAETVIEHIRVTHGWEELRREELFLAYMGGASAIAWDWDKTQGTPLTVDDAAGTPIGTGESIEEALSIAEFGIEPGVRDQRHATWWIKGIAVPVERAKERFGLSWTPKTDSDEQLSPMHRSMLFERGEQVRNLCAVYTLYERPHGKEKGRIVSVINGKVVEERKWTFPDADRLNLRVFCHTKVPGRWFGITPASDARRVQVAYNAIQSLLLEHSKLSGNARLMVPKGALDDETILSDEPGEIVEYWATEGAPAYLAPPQLPRYMTQMPELLEAQMDDLLSTHAVSRGIAPGDRNSGLAISILAERNDTPLGPLGRDQAAGWSEIGSAVLRIYETNVPEVRKVTIYTDRKVPAQSSWSGKDLHGQTRLRVPTENTMPTSKLATASMLGDMLARFPQLAQNIDASALTRVLQVPGIGALAEFNDPNAKWAAYENDVMAGGNPMIPEKWHNHARHIAEHNAFRNTARFYELPEEIKQVFEAHQQAHQRLLETEAEEQAQANALAPGIGGLPQADEPIGSAVPNPMTGGQQ